MVKGMYFFRFSIFNNLSPVPNSVVSLMKNGERLTTVWDTSGTDTNDMGSNAVVIPLNVGDNVYVELQENRIVYDDEKNYNTFSGFLLFTM
ncbi:Complement C1q-like protein 2 C1q and tumor necrosis factor-related protein 10 [Channa argus]|uniref:Complement C1q-like protein 2 C1q and tumor necrosis factor-related protein 10 n=1 Tax=Channa argus TaxID=215402 RepID=A0A6G1QCT3_CHAAH|nr:Complement C1q-like protein 2 C1q and tumor necrosis factor-related protein 10 [Channa argus]